MPVETRAELKALMGELGLPDSADFEDLVTAVRTKNSQLSETETALLFLDEWKKLYLQ
jgi:spore maturation protein CgeB